MPSRRTHTIAHHEWMRSSRGGLSLVVTLRCRAVVYDASGTGRQINPAVIDRLLAEIFKSAEQLLDAAPLPE